METIMWSFTSHAIAPLYPNIKDNTTNCNGKRHIFKFNLNTPMHTLQTHQKSIWMTEHMDVNPYHQHPFCCWDAVRIAIATLLAIRQMHGARENETSNVHCLCGNEKCGLRRWCHLQWIISTERNCGRICVIFMSNLMYHNLHGNMYNILACSTIWLCHCSTSP